VITGSFGLVWLVFWLRVYYLPERHPRISRAELAYIREGSAAPASTRKEGLWASWRGLLARRETWGLLVARIVSDPVWWFYLFWLPKYLVDQRGFTMREMGWTSWMPYLTADLGAVAGGIASGWLLARMRWSPVDARMAVMAGSAALMPLSIWIAYTPSNVAALAIICLATFAHMSWNERHLPAGSDRVRRGHCGIRQRRARLLGDLRDHGRPPPIELGGGPGSGGTAMSGRVSIA
jgi:ACS family hexuronate transporter-like MFS transporter